MEQENDFIKREIQKLTMILMKLFDKTSSADVNSFEAVVFETNEKLEEFFGFTLNEIATTENSKLMEKAESFHEVHLEKLIEVVYQIIQKSEEVKMDFDFETKELSKKLLLMIDFANDKSKSFSVERMNMKSQLIKNSNK
ncbi:hypothetical protein Aeqsu_1111 [Aequorivita sublithincola DSM 14238]|uniref:Uncharacterized protein n=1 Tax=Aequorivita sublithincola (strain DSM 14238 / LMG 21431 / ACAM 643 / 9-3) TaxID=746697 RepID=I3YUE1_AEQSU|nr:hypothetical protein [Aequorivita sublithincola]AFL80609.1 hypothetical protein Aeqsu_1111 [Aequorivita sublithincola DSM 14238]